MDAAGVSLIKPFDYKQPKLQWCQDLKLFSAQLYYMSKLSESGLFSELKLGICPIFQIPSCIKVNTSFLRHKKWVEFQVEVKNGNTNML